MLIEVNERTLIGIKVFENVDTELRGEIAAKCRARRYSVQEQIVSQHDQTDDVYFIVSGKVRATLFSDSGREVIFQDLRSGDMFGELAAIDAEPRSTSVIALQETVLVTMSGSAFREILQSYPPVAVATMRRLSRLVRDHCERIFEFSTLGVKNRIHAELLRLAQENAGADSQVTISDPPTHEEIAKRISTHREAVTRELKELERNGLIKWDRASHIIFDVNKLKTMVDSVVGS
ncbi:MAG: Crp/Fnr family transcriptional regulator [Gammaproteobacteria bacterium]|nr:Crp/Fnr family transcriptional regulator [Gammaproteobacteria bacterium]